LRYCEIIINRWVQFFVDFVVRLNYENKNPTHRSLSVMFETTN
jgi:hypothetical protein